MSATEYSRAAATELADSPAAPPPAHALADAADAAGALAGAFIASWRLHCQLIHRAAMHEVDDLLNHDLAHLRSTHPHTRSSYVAVLKPRCSIREHLSDIDGGDGFGTSSNRNPVAHGISYSAQKALFKSSSASASETCLQ